MAAAALEAAQRDGLHLAGFLAYEFGHALEPRLSGLRPDGAGGGPLLWFGAFPAPRRLARAVLDAAFAARQVFQFFVRIGDAVAAHNGLNRFGEQFPSGIQIGDQCGGVGFELVQAAQVGGET